MMTLRRALQLEHLNPSAVFWVLWYVATFVGGILYVIPVGVVHIALGLDRLDILQHASEFAGWMLVLDAVLCAAACGSTIGLMQWLVLRSRLERIGLWIAATIVGYASIGVLAALVSAFQPEWRDWAFTLIINGKLHWLARLDPSWQAASWMPGAVTLTLFGATLGIAQWLVLRSRVARAAWWIPISTCGWGLAAALSATPGVLPVFGSWDAPVMITGAGMVWLLRRSRQ